MMMDFEFFQKPENKIIRAIERLMLFQWKFPAQKSDQSSSNASKVNEACHLKFSAGPHAK